MEQTAYSCLFSVDRTLIHAESGAFFILDWMIESLTGLTGLTLIYELWPVPSENAQVQGWTESNEKVDDVQRKTLTT